MVMCVKYRQDLLLEKSRIDFLREIMTGISLRYYYKFDAIGVDEDHFHVVVGAAPKNSPSDIMKTIKSWSARLIFKKYPYLRKELWGGEFWSDGGHIDTVSETGGLEKIKNYVKEQGRNVAQLKLHEFK
jgi:putative transposase